jgi:hypothetical protein
MSDPRAATRVVPLHEPERLAAPPTARPRLTYRGGPLLTAVEVFTIFWGPDWQQSSLVDAVNGFFDFVLGSSLMDQLTEYSVPGQQIGHGTRIGTLTVTSPAPPTSLPDADIQTFVEQQVSAGAAPRPAQNTLYFVFLPSGVTVSLGGDSSCSTFCGYHDATAEQLHYAVMPYPDCSGCEGGLTLEDALTVTSSHELCEAVTDPVPGQGWYDDSNGEIGDICAWQTKQLDGYTVQLEWSNRADACI